MFLFRKKSQRKYEAPMVLTPAQQTVEDEPLAISEPAEAPDPGDPALRKRRRPPNNNKTRLMGFDTSDGRVVDLFDEDQAAVDTGRTQFPVAVLMITKGPGLGESFIIKSGMSQIGRGEGQTVRLDFGDMAISRENHAAIVYDPEKHVFLLGHGGKSNIVRLNGKPVITTTDIEDGDVIEIGMTSVRFAALCSPTFNWEITEKEKEESDDDDVEIA